MFKKQCYEQCMVLCALDATAQSRRKIY